MDQCFSMVAEEFEQHPDLCEVLKMWCDGYLSKSAFIERCEFLRLQAKEQVDRIYSRENREADFADSLLKERA